MSDPTSPAPYDGPEVPDTEVPDLSAEQELAVQRLLADAAGPEPVPAEVAERLDATLAELQAQRADDAAALVSTGVAEEHGVVIPRDELAARRRGKARILLAAAAVVAVVGVGAGLVNDQSGDDTAAADKITSEDLARPEEASAGGVTQDDGMAAPSDSSELSSADQEPEGPVQRVTSDEPLRVIRADHLQDDLVALQHMTLSDPTAVDYSGETFAAPQDFVCGPADFGAGYLVAVEYDGRPAVVAFRAPAGTTQAADVLACGTGDTMHSVTLPAVG